MEPVGKRSKNERGEGQDIDGSQRVEGVENSNTDDAVTVSAISAFEEALREEGPSYVTELFAIAKSGDPLVMRAASTVLKRVRNGEFGTEGREALEYRRQEKKLEMMMIEERETPEMERAADGIFERAWHKLGQELPDWREPSPNEDDDRLHGEVKKIFADHRDLSYFTGLWLKDAEDYIERWNEEHSSPLPASKEKEVREFAERTMRDIRILVDQGQVRTETAKAYLYLSNFMKTDNYYHFIITRSVPPRSGEVVEAEREGCKEEYDKLTEAILNPPKKQGNFRHFNTSARVGHTESRVYLSAQPGQEPQEVWRAWREALVQTGLQDRVYFKIDQSGDATRYESVIVYPDTELSDEQMSDLLLRFQELCPERSLAEESMPTGVKLAKGVFYAPEPTLLKFFVKTLQGGSSISYNEFVGWLVTLSSELALSEAGSKGRAQDDTEAFLSAKLYFSELLKLAGIDPIHMNNRHTGHGLPAWAETLRKNNTE